MRLGVVALVLSPLAGCALVAGLGDFGPADETSGNGGAGASGSPTSVTTGTMASSGGGGNGSTTGTMTSTSSSTGPSAGGGGQGNGGGGAGPGGAGGGPSCFDGKKNGNETDQDCGGIDCVPCKIDQMCMNGTDCETTKCGGMKCVCNDHLVISEMRSRGLAGASDEVVEIYNATAAPVTLDGTWSIQSRNAGGANYTTRWSGANQVLPPYHHFLIGGSSYAQVPAADATLTSGITDESSVRLMHDTTVIDALCYCGMGSGNCAALMQGGYSCEGPPMTNPNGAGTDDDASMERKAGGTQGNCVDTIDSSMDFVAITPAQPQDLASLPAPAP